MTGGTRWLSSLGLAVLVGFAMVAGDAQAAEQSQPVALASSIAVATAEPGSDTLRALPHSTSHRKHRRCDLRGHGGRTSVPGLSFLVTAAGNLVPMQAFTCLRRPTA